VPLSIDIRTIARVQVVAWEDGEWGIVWETRDGQRGADRIGKRADAEAIVLAVIGGGLRPASARPQTPRRRSRRRSRSSKSNTSTRPALAARRIVTAE
jgi:hypothetical protein